MKYLKLVVTAIFITGSVFAANTNKNSSLSSRPTPEHIQKAMDQSKEINKLSKQIAKEKDPAAREALISSLRAEMTKQSEEMDKADQQRLVDFDTQREKMVQSITEARIARQQRMGSFIQKISVSKSAKTE